VRIIACDNEEMFAQANTRLQEVEDWKYQGVITPMILLEIIYVLKKVYKMPKDSIIASLWNILWIKNIVLEEGDILFTALWIFKEKSLDFADCYLLAKNKKKKYSWILTFDKKIQKITIW
jgi:predicted nucleic-acid-binding protein